MSERVRVKVDEAELQRMIASDKQEYLTGEIKKPVEKKPELQEEPELPVDAEIVQELPSEPSEQLELAESPKEENPQTENDSGKAPKKRKSKKYDFSELFLKERTIKNRKPIYISVEAYEIIRRYLKYIGDVSFTAYVDNILLQHIEEHKDTITELYNEKVSKPF